MLYACDNCHYLFLKASEETCPDCGKAMIRPATAAEQEDYLNRSKENLWKEDLSDRQIWMAGLASGIDFNFNSYHFPALSCIKMHKTQKNCACSSIAAGAIPFRRLFINWCNNRCKNVSLSNPTGVKPPCKVQIKPEIPCTARGPQSRGFIVGNSLTSRMVYEVISSICSGRDHDVESFKWSENIPFPIWVLLHYEIIERKPTRDAAE